MTFRLTPLNGACGARLEGIDFAAGVDAGALHTIESAVHAHGVLAVSAEAMSPAQQLQIASHFGVPERNDSPFFRRLEGLPQITVLDSAAGDRADLWHADETYLKQPPVMNFLHARQLPSWGGDTAFISACSAWDGLSPRLQALLDGLNALHDLSLTFQLGWEHGAPLLDRFTASLQEKRSCSHPVVATHPVTGRRWLNVNPTYTRFIEGLPPLESRAILDLLWRHLQRPEYGHRHSWRAGDLLIWDQRAVQHYAVRDFLDRRVMHRVSVMPHGTTAPA